MKRGFSITSLVVLLGFFLSLVGCESNPISSSSTPVSSSPPGLPTLLAPSILSTSLISTTAITINWADNSVDESGFALEQCAGINCTNFAASSGSPVAANVASYAATGLVSGLTYRFRVRAYRGHEVSSWLTSSNIATLSIPNAPTNVSFTDITAEGVTVNWTDNSNNETGFVLQQSPAGCGAYADIATPSSDVTSYAVTGLTDGTVYCFRIRATNALGNSAWLSGTAPETLTLPIAPANLTAGTITATTITFSWDDSDTETGYKIYQCDGAACADFAEVTTSDLPADSISYTATGLTPDTIYIFKVGAEIEGGETLSAASAEITTLATPGQPGIPTFTSSTSSSITFGWADNATNESSYTVYQCEGTGCEDFSEKESGLPANTNTYTATSLTAGTIYRFRVTAVVSGATTDSPDSADMTTLSNPTDPTNFTPGIVTASSIAFSWVDNAAGEDHYDVQRCTGTGCTNFADLASPVAPVTSYSDATVAADTIYRYRVRAENANGDASGWLTSSDITAEADEGTWTTDGQVNSIIRSGNTLYIGGTFTNVGQNVGRGVFLTLGSDHVDESFASNSVNGTVYAALEDGSGGFFIGGDFTAVGATSINRIAHILSDGTLDPAWNPGGTTTNGIVKSLALSGGTLYVGGAFTTLCSQARNRIGALNASDGSVTAWNPNADGTVETLLVSGTTVYAGGSFGNIGGQARNRIAALLTADGTASAWNPNADGTIRALAISSGTIYAGGDFINIGADAGDRSRNRIAAIDTTTGYATSWNPNSDGSVYSIVLDGTTSVYAAGSFTIIGGASRNRLAALSPSTGLVSTWNPNVDNTIYAMRLQSSTIYIGGTFTTVGSTTRSRLASIPTSSSTVSSWDAPANNYVYALGLDSTNIYVGGSFDYAGGYRRNRIASLSTSDATVNDWNPNSNGTVNAMAISGSSLYAGGTFTTIGGSSRSYLASINTSTGSASSWNPSSNGSISAIVIDGTTVYVGGTFTSIGGETRNRLAALDSSADATSWNPNANGAVLAMVKNNANIYAAGSFTTVDGDPHGRIVKISTNGVVDAVDFDADNTVTTLAVNSAGTLLYAGGYFTEIGGNDLALSRLAVIDTTTGDADATWAPNANSSVTTIALNDAEDTIYVGGNFTIIGENTLARNRLGAIDIATGDATAGWNPNANSTVHSLVISDSTFFIGGAFTGVGSEYQSGLIAIGTNGAPL